MNRPVGAGLFQREGGGCRWAHARDADLSLELRRLWCHYMQVFNRQKNLSHNYAKFGQAPSKMFSSALLSRKNLKKISTWGHHISRPPRASNQWLARGGHASRVGPAANEVFVGSWWQSVQSVCTASYGSSQSFVEIDTVTSQSSTFQSIINWRNVVFTARYELNIYTQYF